MSRIVLLLCILSYGCRPKPQHVLEQAQLAGDIQILPDYNDTTIPPNIAPLNLKLLVEADLFLVRICGQDGRPVELYSRRPGIRIPMRAWQDLLAANKGKKIRFDVAAKVSKSWIRYEPFFVDISPDPIDRYVVYRLLKPQYNYFKDIGIYQRDIQTFEESCILHGRQFGDGCLNCHSFARQQPDLMALGIRSSSFGNACLCAIGGTVEKLGTRFGHTSWHPSGRLIAFSVFDVRMFFHTARPDVQDVVEMDSLIGYYRFSDHSARRVPGLADPCQLETQPCWSPDGRYLYFASGPRPWPDTRQFPPDGFDQLRYDIKRIAYDPSTDTWGKSETIIAADRIGKSCLMPRPSPDGRFLLFSACDYGCFPIYQASTDLYLLDLDTGQVRPLECNSDLSDSWHTWSSNSRWVVFASKRPTGRFTRLYIAHIDPNGHASKAFVLPQADPCLYDRILYAYNLPELIKGPVKLPSRVLARAVRSSQAIKVDAITSATPTQQQYQQLGQR